MSETVQALDRYSVAEFVTWCDRLPDDGRRWELIDGRPAMMDAPNLRHAEIIDRLAEAFKAGLGRSGLPLWPYQGVAVRPRADADTLLIPDLVILDRNEVRRGGRYPARFFVAVEVTSSSNSRREIETKRAFYREHPHCARILIVEQERVEVIHDWREDHWSSTRLELPDDIIAIGEYEVSLSLRALYEGLI
jgi:Uma2 family endonuclease